MREQAERDNCSLNEIVAQRYGVRHTGTHTQSWSWLAIWQFPISLRSPLCFLLNTARFFEPHLLGRTALLYVHMNPLKKHYLQKNKKHLFFYLSKVEKSCFNLVVKLPSHTNSVYKHLVETFNLLIQSFSVVHLQKWMPRFSTKNPALPEVSNSLLQFITYLFNAIKSSTHYPQSFWKRTSPYI
jgi:hypothetical protein